MCLCVRERVVGGPSSGYWYASKNVATFTLRFKWEKILLNNVISRVINRGLSRFARLRSSKCALF